MKCQQRSLRENTIGQEEKQLHTGIMIQRSEIKIDIFRGIVSVDSVNVRFVVARMERHPIEKKEKRETSV